MLDIQYHLLLTRTAAFDQLAADIQYLHPPFSIK